MRQHYPFAWNDVPADEVLRVKRKNCDYVVSSPGNVWMPKNFAQVAEKIYNFEVRSDDVWIVTYPKCGTTWTQEVVWHIVNNLDIEGSKQMPLTVRSPFLEFQVYVKKTIMSCMEKGDPPPAEMSSPFANSIEFANNAPSPRIIKTHLPLNMLPPAIFEKGCKVVYVCRNPKDSFVSFFHFNAIFENEYMEDFKHLKEMFLAGNLICGDYWYHLKEAWKRRDHPNMKILHYEEMKKDLVPVIRDLKTFLGYNFTERQILKLDDHLRIENHRKHGSKNMSMGNKAMEEVMKKFFRKGIVGDWKQHLRGRDLEEFDSWIRSNLEGSDIKLTFQLDDNSKSTTSSTSTLSSSIL